MQALGNMLFLQVALDPFSNDYVFECLCRTLITTNTQHTKNLKHINRNCLMSTIWTLTCRGLRWLRSKANTFHPTRSGRAMHNLFLKLLHTTGKLIVIGRDFSWKFLEVFFLFLFYWWHLSVKGFWESLGRSVITLLYKHDPLRCRQLQTISPLFYTQLPSKSYPTTKIT